MVVLLTDLVVLFTGMVVLLTDLVILFTGMVVLLTDNGSIIYWYGSIIN